MYGPMKKEEDNNGTVQRKLHTFLRVRTKFWPFYVSFLTCAVAGCQAGNSRRRDLGDPVTQWG